MYNSEHELQDGGTIEEMLSERVSGQTQQGIMVRFTERKRLWMMRPIAHIPLPAKTTYAKKMFGFKNIPRFLISLHLSKCWTCRK